MKTSDLIHALAADARPPARARVARRFHLKLTTGALLALLAVLLLLGVRPDLAQVWHLPMFWLKVLFPASLAVVALVGLRRLGHPGMRLGRLPAAAAVPPVLVWLVAGAVLLGAPAGERLPLLMGRTWLQCPVTITLRRRQFAHRRPGRRRGGRLRLCDPLPRDAGALPGGLVRAGDGDPGGRGGAARSPVAALVAAAARPRAVQAGRILRAIQWSIDRRPGPRAISNSRMAAQVPCVA